MRTTFSVGWQRIFEDDSARRWRFALADAIETVPQPNIRMVVVNVLRIFFAFVDTNEIIRKRIWVDEIDFDSVAVFTHAMLQTQLFSWSRGWFASWSWSWIRSWIGGRF
jgi:hypothetical protein